MARPRRNKFDQLRTQVWYEFIRDQLGLNTAYEMDAYFGTGTDRNWYKYRAGTRVPTHATLAAVERVCLNSRSVFDKGPKGTLLWQAMAAPHVELWEVIDVMFPDMKEHRKFGLIGIAQYEFFFDTLLIPNQYKAELDYIANSKGLQANVIYLAYSKGQVSITSEVAASVIAFWRLASLVLFNMLMADYLLSGVTRVFSHGQMFGPAIDDLICKYINNHLREEYPIDRNNNGSFKVEVLKVQQDAT